MVEKVYKWERVSLKRDTPSDLWRQYNEEVSVITEEFCRSKTSEFEINLFRAMDAKVECYEDGDGWIYFNNTRNDGREKRCEVFIPYDIENFGKAIERQALEETEDMNVIPIIEQTDEHLVVRFGIETNADYDLETDRWVG